MISAVVVVALMFVPLSVVADRVYRVDVNMPQREGRNELEDIEFIHNKLKEFKGVHVIFQGKDYGNKLLVLVLEIHAMCSWNALTSAMSRQGYELSVTIMQRCGDYAKGLGVDLDEPVKDVQNSSFMELLDVTYYDEGMETRDHIAIMNGSKELLTTGIKSVCYRIYGRYPLRVMYFNRGIVKDMRAAFGMVTKLPKTTIEFKLLQNVKTYIEDIC